VSTSRDLKVTAAIFLETPIDIGKSPYSIDWQRELFVNEKFYSSYVHHYEKKTNSGKLNSLQILTNRLK
jgi:hypothetical protein